MKDEEVKIKKSNLEANKILAAAQLAEKKLISAALLAEDKIRSSAHLAEDKILSAAHVAEDKIISAAVIAAAKVKVSNRVTKYLFILVDIILLLLSIKIFKMDSDDRKKDNIILAVLIDIQNKITKLSNSDSIMNIQLQHYPAALPLAISTITRVTSVYSERTLNGKKQFHYGIDYAAKAGTPVYASGDGIVEEAKFMGGFGKIVKINHGNKYESLYGHLSKIIIKNGDAVKRGDILGLVGSTGNSTGNHLHYQIYYGYNPVNPNEFR
jgi:murein DD-endopeptidase MepM/ murein hydrolase activator NlpD